MVATIGLLLPFSSSAVADPNYPDYSQGPQNQYPEPAYQEPGYQAPQPGPAEPWQPWVPQQTSPPDTEMPAPPAAAQPAPSGITPVRYQYSNAAPAQTFGNLYLPQGAHAAKSLPIVIYIHGGGWKLPSNVNDSAAVSAELAKRGVAVFNIEYRRMGSGGGYQQTLTDVANAIDFLPELARKVPALNTRNVVAAGHSAGGHLAAWLAGRNSLPPGAPGGRPKLMPRKVVSIAGVLDLWTAAILGNPRILRFMGGTPAQRPYEYWIASPSSHPNNRVPVIALQGANDRDVPLRLARIYSGAMTLVGGDTKIVSVPNSNHVNIVNTRHSGWTMVRDTILRAAKK